MQPSWERHRAGERPVRADEASGDRSRRLPPRAVPVRRQAHGAGPGGAGAEVPLPAEGPRGGHGGGELLPDQEPAQAPVGPDLGEHTLADLLGSIFDLTYRQLSVRGPE
ncbi:hypothetical protein SAMN05216533_1392 [Streptomyces sp. Ag109_O5-10]|nr:hypothetical protein SAMN05216533_1392 [Streptomyces sp. Ag109_O5-10]